MVCCTERVEQLLLLRSCYCATQTHHRIRLWPRVQAAKAAALLERAQMLRRELEDQDDSSWRAFEDLLDILQASGALEAAPEGQATQHQLETHQLGAQQQDQEPAAAEQPQQGVEPAEELEAGVAAAEGPSSSGSEGSGGESGGGESGAGARITFTPLGKVAREVNCANELWMALVLTHAALQGLAPPQLAAVLSAGVGGGGGGWDRRRAAAPCSSDAPFCLVHVEQLLLCPYIASLLLHPTRTAASMQ